MELENAKDHFQRRVWMCIYHNYAYEQVLKQIIRSADADYDSALQQVKVKMILQCG